MQSSQAQGAGTRTYMRVTKTAFLWLIGVARFLRDAWLMIGVTLALILVLEGGYRTQAALRNIGRTTSASLLPGPPSPFDTTPWAREYLQDAQYEESLRWTPYVYFRNPTFTGKHISVDSAGHRVTPMPSASGGTPVRVFFLGGSTAFGWFQRDAQTIPAETARQLQAALGPAARVEVTNFGVPGHTFTQEILELMLQLQAGARPDVVVFYDGINDVMATVQNGVAGIPQNESHRVADFLRGRREELQSDVRLICGSILAALQRLELVQRLERLELVQRLSPPEAAPLVPADSMTRSLLRVYVENARMVEALATAYGFRPVYVWQPTFMSTTKPLSAREKWLADVIENDPFLRRHRDLHQALPPLLAAAMAPIAGDRFVDATGLFRDDSLDVYADLFGHHFERVNPQVVAAFLPQLTTAARTRMSMRGDGETNAGNRHSDLQ